MLAKLQRWQRTLARRTLARRTLARRTLARRTVGSRGWPEAQGRINAIHRRVNGLRDHAHHQVSRQLVRKCAVLAIESLNVAGMDQLPHQAKAIRDAAIGGLLQKIRYKADWYGTISVAADRFYPSSKLCSDCGAHHASLGAGTALDLPTVRPATRSQRKCRAQSANTGNQRGSRAG